MDDINSEFRLIIVTAAQKLTKWPAKSGAPCARQGPPGTRNSRFETEKFPLSEKFRKIPVVYQPTTELLSCLYWPYIIGNLLLHDVENLQLN